MLRKVFAVVVIAGLTSWSMTAPALAHRVSEEARACLRTEPVQFQGTIVDAAVATAKSSTKEFSTLVQVLTAAGLVDDLSQSGHFTVFAPTEAAFKKIPTSLLKAIVDDPEVLNAVLTYHVVPGSVGPRRSTRVKEVDTLLGQSVFLSVDEKGPYVNQSNIACQAIQTTNGTIFVIDSVLLPQF